MANITTHFVNGNNFVKTTSYLSCFRSD